MPSLKPYRQELDYGYAPGFFPSMECLIKRPECARRVLLNTEAKGDAVEKLIRLADEQHVRVEMADKVLRWVSRERQLLCQRLSLKSVSRSFQQTDRISCCTIPPMPEMQAPS